MYIYIYIIIQTWIVYICLHINIDSERQEWAESQRKETPSQQIT